MSLAACLLLYSAVVLLGGPPVLRALTRVGRAPRLGAATWLIAIVSVLATWLVSAVLIVVDEVAHGSRRHSFIDSCIEILCRTFAGQPGGAPRSVVLLGAAAVVAAVAVVAVRLACTIARLRTQARDHAHGVRLVGRPILERRTFVVDADVRAAYCVAGKPPTIVVTSAAVSALDEHQMRAVLAHEWAHVRGHHLEVTILVRAVAAVLPRLALMRDGAMEVTRLLEMCADVAAARRFGREAVLGGLLTLAGAAPATALGAADVAVVSRAERLTSPPADGVRHIDAALAGTAALVALAPLAALSLAASGVFVCS
ncbi:M56 family metallopeptidase [Mycolicibacterium frederiksbergense]|uniref:M56 family peptidase n=1 Tax=Mycolicibacterium frederiksbergense TaxID=117567 RepID=A0A6H0RWX8_9MYCO|nr:M56 family metallopeptidase [Mycolicibacterium frederiksbergense]QIV79713.1 M56 family peptidase [Mycolicibacterium frederiksbergense]